MTPLGSDHVPRDEKREGHWGRAAADLLDWNRGLMDIECHTPIWCVKSPATLWMKCHHLATSSALIVCGYKQRKGNKRDRTTPSPAWCYSHTLNLRDNFNKLGVAFRKSDIFKQLFKDQTDPTNELYNIMLYVSLYNQIAPVLVND